MRAICIAVLACTSEPRSGNTTGSMPIERSDGKSSPPALKVASSGRKRVRSRRRNSSNSWRSVPPTFRQSTTCRTAIGSRH